MKPQSPEDQQRVVDMLNARLSRRGLLAFSVGGAIFLTACGSSRVPASQLTATTASSSGQAQGTSTSVSGGSGTPSASPVAGGGTPVTGSSDLIALRTKYDSRNLPNLPGWKNGPKNGGTYKIIEDAPDNWDLVGPAAGTLASWSPRHFNQLITFKKGDHANNHTLELESDLAESWKQIDPTTYEFKIHQGVKWQNLEPMNGRELVAADIKYALEVYKAKSAVIGPLLEVVDTIDTPDDYTLRIKLHQPAAYFLRSLAQPPLQIFGREAYESASGLKQRPVGTGAFILTDQGSHVGMKMKKNPTYFKKDPFNGKQLPYLDGIETTYIPDPATALAAFRTNQIMHYGFFNAPVTDLYSLLQTNPNTVVLVNPPAPTGQTYLSLRLDKAPWNDVRVRQAMSLAIDREAIINTVFKGVAAYSQPMDWSYFGSDWPLDGKDLGQYMQYDPERAKKLLADAGMSSGIKGTMPSQWNTGIQLNQLELVQEYWRKVGIDIQIQTPDTTQFTQLFYSANYPDLIAGYFLTQGTDPDNFTYERMYSKSTRNIYHINDPKVDELCLQERGELDPDKRKQIIKQLNDIALDQMFWIWLVNPYYISVRQPYVYNAADGLYAWESGWACGVEELVWLDQ